MRLAGLSGPRHRPHAHANLGGSAALDEIPRVDAHRHFRQSHCRAALREARLPDNQVIHRRRLAPLTLNLFRFRNHGVYYYRGRKDQEMERLNRKPLARTRRKIKNKFAMQFKTSRLSW